MGETTGIAWCDHTHNIAIGCEKVSPACKNCYAAVLDKHRFGGTHWGPGSDRKLLSEAYWKQPAKWQRAAAAAGVRRRVFSSSLADVFEDHPDLVAPRMRLWRTIVETPDLDWLLLTKRPENIARFAPWTRGISREVVYNVTSGKLPFDQAWYDAIRAVGPATPPWSNVWLGTTTESQQYAEERLPHLLAVPAVVHFVSAEPLLGPVYLNALRDDEVGAHWNAFEAGLDWVITGCESGPGRRDSDVEWYRALQRQCSVSGTPFFFKQARAHAENNPPPISRSRSLVIYEGEGSWSKKDGTIEQPYLDGKQYIEFPNPRGTFRTADAKKGDTSDGVR